MQKNHLKIYKIAHDEIYNFIKLSNTHFEDYNFIEYFEYITTLENIVVFEHHFPKTKILGVTKIDEEGKTISYEKDLIEARQNFTKCHEIGHIVLNHEGGFFTEQLNNKDPKETEADYFSSIILAPDIILLQKILIEQKNFQQITDDLMISKLSLLYRLSTLAQKYEKIFYDRGNEISLEFKAHPNNSELVKILDKHKYDILNIFKKTKIDTFKKIQYLIYNETPFISNYDVESLSKKKFREKISQSYPNYNFWAYYDKGKSIWFCWDTQLLSKEKACQIAKNTLFINELN